MDVFIFRIIACMYVYLLKRFVLDFCEEEKKSSSGSDGSCVYVVCCLPFKTTRLYSIFLLCCCYHFISPLSSILLLCFCLMSSYALGLPAFSCGMLLIHNTDLFVHFLPSLFYNLVRPALCDFPMYKSPFSMLQGKK